MCEAGRVVHHLKTQTFLIRIQQYFLRLSGSSYIGRKILEGEEYVKHPGRDYKVRAHVCRLEGTSGHADQQGIDDLAWRSH